MNIEQIMFPSSVVLLLFSLFHSGIVENSWRCAKEIENNKIATNIGWLVVLCSKGRKYKTFIDIFASVKEE